MRAKAMWPLVAWVPRAQAVIPSPYQRRRVGHGPDHRHIIERPFVDEDRNPGYQRNEHLIAGQSGCQLSEGGVDVLRLYGKDHDILTIDTFGATGNGPAPCGGTEFGGPGFVRFYEGQLSRPPTRFQQPGQHSAAHRALLQRWQ